MSDREKMDEYEISRSIAEDLRFFDPLGRPITQEQWSEEWSDREKNGYHKQTPVAGLVVSTTYLGLAQWHIFETLVLAHEWTKDTDEYEERHSTWEEAMNYHNEVIDRLLSEEVFYAKGKQCNE